MISIGYSGTILTNQPIYKLITLLTVPIFSFLLVDSFEYTKDNKKYLIKIWFIALIIQILFTIGVDTFNLNGIFGMIIAMGIINRLKRGEWYWVHLFMFIAICIPIEYGDVTVALTTLYYLLKHKEDFNSLKKIYLLICILIPLLINNPIEYIIAICFSLILYWMNPNSKYKLLNLRIKYILLGISYLVMVVIRFVILSYK